MKICSSIKIVTISFFIIFITIQCSRDYATQQNDDLSNDLFPLFVGNEWYYEMEDSSISRHWIDSSYIYYFQDASYTLYDLMIDYGSWAGKKTLFFNNEGLCFTLFWKIEIDSPLYIFKYPVEVGDSWENIYNDSYLSYTNIDSYKVRNSDAKIKVPAGNFNCYLYEIAHEAILYDGSKHKYKLEYYFQPGIGLIAIKRIEEDEKNPGNMIETYEKRLVSYSLIE